MSCRFCSCCANPCVCLPISFTLVTSFVIPRNSPTIACICCCRRIMALSFPSSIGASRRRNIKYRPIPCSITTTRTAIKICNKLIRYSILHDMAIHETLKKSIPDALRAHDEVKLRTLRSLVTAMTNEVVAKKRKPDEYLIDDEALAVIKRAVNQRKDSIEQFEKASRTDLVEAEKLELALLESYLPAMMSRDEILVIAKAKMAELGVSSKADAGKFTGALMKELKGKADGGDVKAVVDSLLS